VIPSSTICDDIKKNGFAICENVLSALEAEQFLNALAQINEAGSIRTRGGVFAIRNLLDVSQEVRDLASSSVVRNLVEPILDSNCFPVRGILFDKIPEANWKVPWHQDVTIAVQHKIETEGFGPWSIKADVLHVQPPAAVLENMLSVRLHLDPCGEENGALRVIPGSHAQGRIPEDLISSIRQTIPEHVCAVGLGGALLMRPLLLHASSTSQVPEHRRVIHLDFAAVQLPRGMNWFSESPIL
jgi:ectoine hydroxylase-related dioxygenase (phytanoyl-CoA dioxygenase family)